MNLDSNMTMALPARGCGQPNFQSPWKTQSCSFPSIGLIPDPHSLFSVFTTQETQHLCIITKRWQGCLLFIEVFICVACLGFVLFLFPPSHLCNFCLLPHSCFTLLCQFLLYSKVSQPHAYVCVCACTHALLWSDSLQLHGL